MSLEYLEYKTVCQMGIISGNGESVGVRIELANGRDITQDEQFQIDKIAEQIYELVQEGNNRSNPKRIEDTARDKRGLLGCFPSLVYMEEIPNGYCPKYCCKDKPWYLVTTTKGPIRIGWRKRVIEITWMKETNPRLAEDLFSDYYPTKFDRTIHAYGYEKAKEYIERILAGEASLGGEASS